MAPRTRRALFSASLFLATCAILGSLINQKVAAQSASDESTLRDSLHSFTNVYSLVEQNYAEPMNTDKTDKAIYDGAIPGMLHVLDPHSNFYDPKAYAQMREDQHGKYYGVGMTIQPQPVSNGSGKTKIVVLYPFEGTPSYKAGIRPGDEILTVDGKSTEGMDTTGVASMLKGARGTHVSVTISREGAARPMVFDLVRDEIPRPSVDLAFLIRPGVGYIHVSSFIETTSREVGDALDSFGEIHGLVLDLRGNPGGLLNEAVNTSDKFLQKGQIVVSQRGRAFPDQIYRATRGEEGPKFPIVVLVNRNTASAAEIVSGALQDHDRALIVGETTFGKGLVQTVFTITENTGLALTTYHYYTPSGRLIQRNYTNISFLDYYYGKRGETKDPNDIKQTDLGRTVYGGGGITPDEKFEPAKLDAFELSVARKNAFFGFSAKYFSDHDTKLQKGWVPDEAVVESFHDYLLKQNLKFSEEDWARDHAWIRDQLRAEMYVTAFSYEDSQRVGVEQDLEVQKAIDAMPKAASLLAQSKTRFEKQRASLR